MALEAWLVGSGTIDQDAQMLLRNTQPYCDLCNKILAGWLASGLLAGWLLAGWLAAGWLAGWLLAV